MVNIVTPFSSQKWDLNSKEDSRIKRTLTFQAKAALIVALLLTIIIIAVIVVIFALPQSPNDWLNTFISQSKLGRYQHAAISTDAAPCAPIGREILMKNGTVIDAAIAVLVCMGAHSPHSMGLGGGFLMLLYNRTEERAYYIDARETAPRNATVDMFKGNGTSSSEGGLSIAVPGELVGYWQAYVRFGRLPWKDLFTPTIEMCRNGIQVSAHLARAIRTKKEFLMKYEDLGNVFLKNGTDVYEEGERIKMPALANTLEAIAENKLQALYGTGELATKFLEDLKNAGSIIDSIDMLSYTPRMGEPVKVILKENSTLYGVPPPGSGALLAFMMAILDGFPDMKESIKSDLDRTALAYHRIIEAMKFGYAHRSELEDHDSEEMQQLIKNLTSKDYADEVRRRIIDFKTFNDISYYGDKKSFAEDHGTAHLSIVGPNGDAVSVTSTINQYFGSKILSPSTGIILNDEMDDFSSPNITNMFDLPPTVKNNIKPGRRPMSSMSPTIIVDKDGEVRLVLGGNGGTTITTGVLQVAVRNFFFGEDIKQSIDAPRLHHQLLPNVLHYEYYFPHAIVDKLVSYGHHAHEWSVGMMSIIMAIARDENGYLCSNSDYRKGGEVDGF